MLYICFSNLIFGDTPVRKNPSEIAAIFWTPLRYFFDITNLKSFQKTDALKVNMNGVFPTGRFTTPLVNSISRRVRD